MAVKPVPDGYHTITPYLCIDGAAAAIDYYTRVFGATETVRMPMPGGKIGHAEITIGDAVVMLADEAPEVNARGPLSIGGSPVMLMIYVPDCDAVFHKAIAEGGTEMRPLKTEFYGDRSGHIRDPFGHLWTIATHVEDVSPEEMERRMAAMTGGEGS